jgi:integrase
LAETGRRRGSVAGLRWSDFDFAHNTIRWQAEFDKTNKTGEVGYPAWLLDEVRSFQRRLGEFGGFLFPMEKDPARATYAEKVTDWIVQAESVAGLAKLTGGVSHPYRRKWRGERSAHPLKAVAVAGGWSDVSTMLRCYDQPDHAAVLAVTSETNRRREQAPHAVESDNEIDQVRGA